MITVQGTIETGLHADYQEAIMGTWIQDTAKSRFSPGPAPHSQIRTYEPAGSGYKLTFEGVTGYGVQDAWQYTADYDGKDYPVIGSDAADTIALSQVDAYTTLGVFKKNGQEVGMYKRKIDRDGKTLTITTAGVTAHGQPSYDVTVFHKQPPAAAAQT